MADASTITYTQPGTGAVSRTLSTFLNQHVSATDFGVAVGVSPSNPAAQAASNATALNAAMNSLPNGGTVSLPPGPILLTGCAIPPFVNLVGVSETMGQTNQANHDLRSKGTVLLITSTWNNESNPSLVQGYITIENCGLLKSVAVVRDGLDYPSTPANYASNLAKFTGTAIQFVGDDAMVEDVLVAGFRRAVYSGYSSTAPDGNLPSRPTISRVWFDCLAGVEIAGTYDLARITDCHGWPFYTSINNDSNSAGRSGAAYRFVGRNDGILLDRCFSYGHAIGYSFEGLGTGVQEGAVSAVVTNCLADGPLGTPGLPSSVGFKTSGQVRLWGVNNHMDSQITGYDLGHVDSSGCVLQLSNCSAGNMTAAWAHLAAGSSGVVNGFLGAGQPPNGFVVDNGVLDWRISNYQVNSASLGAVFTYGSDAARRRVRTELTTIDRGVSPSARDVDGSVPLFNQNTDYTLSALDDGRQLLHNGGTAATFTIPANATAAIPVGAVITVMNYAGAANVTIALQTGVFLNAAGSSAIGTRTLTGNMAKVELTKIATDNWVISGFGYT